MILNLMMIPIKLNSTTKIRFLQRGWVGYKITKAVQFKQRNLKQYQKGRKKNQVHI